MRALIVGANGQDGRILRAKLLHCGIQVFGINKPRTSGLIRTSPRSGYEEFNVDFSKKSVSQEILDMVQPTYIFHVAAVHGNSLNMHNIESLEFESMKICHVEITQRILEWQIGNKNSFSVFALSSQMYKNSDEFDRIIDESMLPDALTEYAKSKASAWSLIKQYRSQYNVKASGVIFFNHTSHYSKSDFLFKEVAAQLASTFMGGGGELKIKNPLARVDICSAEDAMDAFYRIAQKGTSDDYTVGYGETFTIKDVIEETIKLLKMEMSILVGPNAGPKRALKSNISKANIDLGWRPTSTPSQILSNMVLQEVFQRLK